MSANPPTPLWAFGEGVGYTTFAITSMHVESQLPGNESIPFIVRVAVNNTGLRAGATVVQVRDRAGLSGACVLNMSLCYCDAPLLAQVYAQDPVGAGIVVRPWKRLVAFSRVTDVPAGSSASVAIDVQADDLAYYGDDTTLQVRGDRTWYRRFRCGPPHAANDDVG
jgi:hypothetical protein